MLIGDIDPSQPQIFESESTEMEDPAWFAAEREEVDFESFRSPDLSNEQNGQLVGLLRKFKSSFSSKPGRCSSDFPKHDIELTEEKPFCAKPYRQSPSQREVVKKAIKEMLEQRIITPGKSDYLSPLILVNAPGKEPRVCIDYRILNKITKDQIFPIPFIVERVERVAAAKYISVLDLSKGYWQLGLTERAKKYSAFICAEGTFLPNRMFFGLKNAGYCFNELIQTLLKGSEEYAVHFFDDIAVISQDFEEHLKHLHEVLTKVSNSSMTLKPKKCEFARKSVNYLGHKIGGGKRSPMQIKVEAIDRILRPLTKKDIRAFLGITGYYRHYIRGYATLTAPFTNALRKGSPNVVY
jgi:hypothetical protein